MEIPESSKRRRIDCSGRSLCIENVERNDGGVDCKHKVFLCHSGKQKDFVEQMCDEIERHDRSAFFDKNRRSLPLGCDFPKEIFKAIEECEAGVVVLSKAFFMKTWWPMQELARLAKRTEENKEFVLILVYYDIKREECRDVKKQMEWIEEWEKWAQLDKRIVIEDWTFVFKLFGPSMSISRNGEGDAKRVVREVVAEVCKGVTPETRGDDLDMQGRQRICELLWDRIQASEVSRGDGTRVVGLYGMGGIGKSILCKALCEKLRSDFGGRVCHAELASNSDEGKEKEMLGEMVKRLIRTAHEVVVGYNKTERLNLLMARLREQRVFLAVDNVEDGASSKKLARDLLNSTYAKDSFVVVTARTIEILQDVGISRKECQEMPELNYEEAKSLFLKNAPKWACQNDFLIRKCIGMCCFSKGEGRSPPHQPPALKEPGVGEHYHPLALKVLGGQVGYDPEECMRRLEGPDPFNALRERQHPIFSILRSSFDLLKSADQLLFMDVALFCPKLRKFNHEPYPSKDVNIMTWLRLVHGSNEDDLVFRLNALKRKSLIECIGDGTHVVGIHDLWQEFCVTETMKEDSRSQRWFYKVDEIHESVNESRFYSGGWEDLQRACLDSSNLMWKGSLKERLDSSNLMWKGILKERPLSLQRCSNLIVLKLVNVELKNGVVDVSPRLQLKSLEVHLTPLMFMDLRLRKKEVALDIKGLGKLVDLRVLIVLGIPKNSACIGEIASLVCLEVLVLIKLDPEMLDMKKPGMTRLLDLGDLRCLQFVRLRMGGLPSQVVWSSMVNLQHLDLGGNDKLLSCNVLEDLTALVELVLEGCGALQVLPYLGKLTALVELVLDGCGALEVLPYLGKLTKLKKLNISWCKEVSSVPGLDCLVALEHFYAHECTGLKRLPDLQRLSNLRVLDLRGCLVEPILGLEMLTSLRQLGVHFDMVKDSPKQCPLTKLQDVDIESWGRQGLPCMVGWTGLERLEIRGSRGVRKLEGLKSLPSLQFLQIHWCDFWDVSIVSCLTSLQTLRIESCKELKEVPSLVQLSKLESLHLGKLGFATWEVCGTIPQLRKLTIQDLKGISLLELGHLPELRSLALQWCESLTDLTSDGPLAMLEDLRIYSCEKLEFLPSFKACTRLLHVDIKGCRNFNLNSDGPGYWFDYGGRNRSGESEDGLIASRPYLDS